MRYSIDDIARNVEMFSTRSGSNSFPEVPITLRERLRQKYMPIDDGIFAHAIDRTLCSWFEKYCLTLIGGDQSEELFERSDLYFFLRGIRDKAKEIINKFGTSWKMEPPKTPKEELWETLSCFDVLTAPKFDFLSFLSNYRDIREGFIDPKSYATSPDYIFRKNGPLYRSVPRQHIIDSLAGKVLIYDQFEPLLRKNSASSLENKIDYEIEFMGGKVPEK